jgi:hypothetical protein
MFGVQWWDEEGDISPQGLYLILVIVAIINEGYNITPGYHFILSMC